MESAGTATLSSVSEDSTAYALHAYGSAATPLSTNTVTAVKDILLIGTGAAVEVLSANYGANQVISTQGDVTVEGTGAGSASDGLNAANNGTNTVQSMQGNVTVKAASTSSITTALKAEGNSTNTVDSAGAATLSAVSEDAAAYALYAGGSAGITLSKNTVIAGGDVALTARTEASSTTIVATGLHATYGANEVHSAQGDITVEGISANSAARGLSAINGGMNTVQSDVGKVEIHAGSGGATAYALYVDAADSENRVIASEVEITGAASSGATSYAMYALDAGVNSIDTGAGDDVVRITGNFYAEFSGVNSIDTGAGDDFVHITGNISSEYNGVNSIDTGAGDDVIHLNGQIGTSALTLDAGEGSDVLILQAGNTAGFNSNYQNWLNSYVGGVESMNVENITIRLDDIGTADMAVPGWLGTVAQGAGIGLSYDWGLKTNLTGWNADLTGTANDNDVLRLYGDGQADAALTLLAGGVNITGFESLVVDLRGETADTVSLSDLLDNINVQGGPVSGVERLFINADGNDTVDAGGYASSGTIEINGIVYDQYASDEVALIYIQQTGG